MGDLKRTDKKEVKLEEPVQTGNKIQVIQGNVDVLSLQMLDAINKHLALIAKTLIELKDKK